MTFICQNIEQRLSSRPACNVQCRSCYEREGRLKEVTAPFDAGSAIVDWRETLIVRLARLFPETFTPFGNRKEPNALAGNVVDAILDVFTPPALPAGEEVQRALDDRFEAFTIDSWVSLPQWIRSWADDAHKYIRALSPSSNGKP